MVDTEGLRDWLTLQDAYDSCTLPYCKLACMAVIAVHVSGLRLPAVCKVLIA